MIYRDNNISQVQKNRIKNDLNDELVEISYKEQLGTINSTDEASRRHIKAALKGKLYADLICKSYMVKNSMYQAYC
jgi:hypothetical protein